MTCVAITQTAPHGAASASPHRRATSRPSAPCAPAASTGNGASTDGATDIIQSRADRLTFSNDVQRARFIEIHQTLSRRSSDHHHINGESQ